MNRILLQTLGWFAVICPGIFADVTTVSYFGGAGDDEVKSAAFASDGSIILAGTSASATLAGVAGTRLAHGAGFVAKLDRAGASVRWLVRMAAVKKIAVGAGDVIYVLFDQSVSVLAADGSAFLRQGNALGATTVDMDVAPDGSVAVLAGGIARFLEPDGAERWNKPVGRSSCLCIAIDPLSKNVWVGGDQNTNTGYEPWRSPFLFQYSAAAGDRTAVLYNWPGPAVRADGKQLQSDSSIRQLKFTPGGRLWIGAWSDGGNTVLTKEPDNLDQNQDALTGACFPNPCFGYKGAKSTGMFARMKSPITDMERGSWVVPYLGMNPATHLHPPCGCKGANFEGAGVNPGSFGMSGIFPIDSAVIVLGNPWGKGPATPGGWFYNTVYAGGGIGWVGVFTNDLTQITQASMIPGTRNAIGDYQRGRLLVAGRAADLSAVTPDPAEADFHVSLPTTAQALQKDFAGGASDGYFLLACMTTTQECAASALQGRQCFNWRTSFAPAVLTARAAVRLGPAPKRGVYAVTTASGQRIAGGIIPADRMIGIDRSQARGVCILRVSGMGSVMTWRIVAHE